MKKNCQIYHKYEKLPPKLKCSHKWLEGRYAPLDLGNVQEKETPTEDTIVPETVDTVPNSSSTLATTDQRLLK